MFAAERPLIASLEKVKTNEINKNCATDEDGKDDTGHVLDLESSV